MMEVKNINNNNIIPKTGIFNRHMPKITKTNANKYSCKKSEVSFRGINIRRNTCQVLMWISDNISSPQQRALLGVTALCTQPFIDLYNSHIKKEDKPITVAKTISKIVIGTTAGILMRHYAIKIVKNFTKDIKTTKYSQCLLPKKIVEKFEQKIPVHKNYLENYRKGLGTFIGTTCGLFTNFLIDAPLSKYLTNTIHEKVFLKENSNEQ